MFAQFWPEKYSQEAFFLISPPYRLHFWAIFGRILVSKAPEITLNPQWL
jgi:hypothetical protein